MKLTSFNFPNFRRKTNRAKPEDQASSSGNGKQVASGSEHSPKSILKQNLRSGLPEDAQEKPRTEPSNTKRLAINIDGQIHSAPLRNNKSIAEGREWTSYVEQSFSSIPHSPSASSQTSSSSHHGPELSRTDSQDSWLNYKVLDGSKLSRTDSQDSLFFRMSHGEPKVSRSDSMDSITSISSIHDNLSETPQRMPTLRQVLAGDSKKTLVELMAEDRQTSLTSEYVREGPVPTSPRAGNRSVFARMAARAAAMFGKLSLNGGKRNIE